MREAINKLASSTAKRTLQCIPSSHSTKVPCIEPMKTAPQTIQRSAWEPPLVVTNEVHIPPNFVIDKGKGVAFEESEKELLKSSHLPPWHILLAAIVVEFYPPHFRKKATSIREMQSTLLQNLLSVCALSPIFFNPFNYHHLLNFTYCSCRLVFQLFTLGSLYPPCTKMQSTQERNLRR